MKKNKYKSKGKINGIDVTKDTFTVRGGIALLFVKYLSNLEIYT